VSVVYLFALPSTIMLSPLGRCWFVAAQLASTRIASTEGVPGSGL
jgi:hypothetical protein